jgi:DNA modification methylase
MSNVLEKFRHGFVDYTREDKDIANAARLQDNHQSMVSLFGGSKNLPSSVILVKRDKLNKEEDEHASEKSCVEFSREHGFLGDESIRSKTMRKMKYISKTGSQNGALSRFPQDLARKIVLFYTKPGDVVVDPFAGHNSRMEACVRAGCSYCGQELLLRFHESNQKRAWRLRKEFGTKIWLVPGDSRNLMFSDSVGDFGFTCPPYWNIEDYDPTDPQQLGNLKYPEFLKGLGRVMREHYRTLKPGALCVWVVNFFRHQGKLIRFHDDTKALAVRAGFVVHDEAILDHGRAMRDAFFHSCYKLKQLPKRHEYILVFKKPNEKR